MTHPIQELSGQTLREIDQRTIELLSIQFGSDLKSKGSAWSIGITRSDLYMPFLSERSRLRISSMVQKCWVPPVDIDNLSGIASVGVDVSSNGDLIGQPEVVRYVPGQESLSKSLVDALFACSAFKGLPTGEYAAWKKLVINVSKKHTGLYLYDDGAVR